MAVYSGSTIPAFRHYGEQTDIQTRSDLISLISFLQNTGSRLERLIDDKREKQDWKTAD
jgi:hypothetical protein